MSYSFGLYFKQCSSFEEAFKIAMEATKLLRENKVEYIKQNVQGCPSILYEKMNSMADRYWLYDLFSLKFVYFKKYDILALSGYEYPKPIENLFQNHISFQNSTDQNYPLDEWSDEITLFKQLKEKCVAENLNDYNTCSKMYERVFKALHLHDYIYRDDNKAIECFLLQAIDNENTHVTMNVLLKRAIEETLEEEIECFAEMVVNQITVTDEVLQEGKIIYREKEYIFDKNNIPDENVEMYVAKQIVRTNFINRGKMEE